MGKERSSPQSSLKNGCKMKISPFIKNKQSTHTHNKTKKTHLTIQRARAMEISANNLTLKGVTINSNRLIAFVRNCHDAILSPLCVLGAELRRPEKAYPKHRPW